jgi:exodeoxyribonuclease VII small subunit
MPKMKKKEETFESALKRLQEIVDKMEAGEISLEDSLKSFEEGIGLVRFLNVKLTEAKNRVELLTKDESGRVKAVPFEPEEELEDPEE